MPPTLFCLGCHPSANPLLALQTEVLYLGAVATRDAVIRTHSVPGNQGPLKPGKWGNGMTPIEEGRPGRHPRPAIDYSRFHRASQGISSLSLCLFFGLTSVGAYDVVNKRGYWALDDALMWNDWNMLRRQDVWEIPTVIIFRSSK